MKRRLSRKVKGNIDDKALNDKGQFTYKERFSVYRDDYPVEISSESTNSEQSNDEAQEEVGAIETSHSLKVDPLCCIA